MDQCSLIELLGQASASEAGEAFRQFLRGGVRQMFLDVMAAEVGELCGVKHHPIGEVAYRRAGSAPGSILWEGNRDKVQRPRVRRQKQDGRSEEVRLRTYESARQPGQLHAIIVRSLIAGVSGREMKEVHPESSPASKSSVSRLWAKAGAKLVGELRTRDIGSQDWLVLMLDGIALSKDQTAVVALGITAAGTKHILDFELGSSENNEVCRDLVGRLVERGFSPTRRLLSVLDGSQSLKNAVLQFFPDAVIQRCLVHKERNIRARLSKRDWGELARLFKRLREVEGEAAGREVVGELEEFLAKKNAEAFASLREAGEELIALHKLDVPSTLHKSLLSTNIIENTFRNARRKLGRVTRFRAETDQASRWLAAALLEAEKGFHRIRGYADLGALAKALDRGSSAASPAGAATPLRPTACASPPPQPAPG